MRLDRVGLRISGVFERVVPDPFVLAVLLTLATAAIVLAFGSWPTLPAGGSRLARRFAGRGGPGATPRPIRDSSSAHGSRRHRRRPPAAAGPRGRGRRRAEAPGLALVK